MVTLLGRDFKPRVDETNVKKCYSKIKFVESNNLPLLDASYFNVISCTLFSIFIVSSYYFLITLMVLGGVVKSIYK